MSVLFHILNSLVTAWIVSSVQQFVKVAFCVPWFYVLFHEHDVFQ